jgi:hypothetical protein
MMTPRTLPRAGDGPPVRRVNAQAGTRAGQARVIVLLPVTYFPESGC